jgi:hypothetical protein
MPVEECLHYGRSYGWERLLGVLFAIGLAKSPAFSDTVTLVPAKDNTLIESRVGDASNGAGPYIFSGRTGMTSDGKLLRAVVAFDVAASVPAGSTITGATLTLVLVQTISSDSTHTLYKLQSDWGQGTSMGFGGMGAPSTPGDATWIHTFYPNAFWANPGGDYDGNSTADQIVTGFTGPYDWTSPQMAADVQGWLDDPCSNFGWILIGDEAKLMTAKKFGSSEAKLEFEKPKLTIEYTPGAVCAADLAGDDGVVNVDDLLAVINAWGPCVSECCAADLAGDDGVVNVDDLLAVINAWGPCP